MKQNILSVVVFMLFSTAIATASTAIDLSKIPTKPGPVPCSLTISSVSAAIDANYLSVYFDSPLGNATITVTDSFGQIIAQQVVDTNTTTEVLIPIDTWDTGDYIIIVRYGTTTLGGEFLIP
jgi:hypothetical protein